MSNNQQSGTGQNQQRQVQGGSQSQQQQTNRQQFRGNGGDGLWNAMNARVGNPSAALIDPHLVMQLVGPIPGVAPVPARNQQQQQYPVQGTGGQTRQPAASQPQESNLRPSLSRRQVPNVAQPQQPIPHAQGQQESRSRTPMSNNQQGPTGNSMSGNVGAGTGRGAPSLGPGAGTEPFQNSGTGRGQPGGSSKGRVSKRRDW